MIEEKSLLSEKAFRSLSQLQDEICNASPSRLVDIRLALVDLVKLVDSYIEKLTAAIGGEKK